MPYARFRPTRSLYCVLLLASGCAAHESAGRAQEAAALARLEQQAADLEAASPEVRTAALKCPARPKGVPPPKPFDVGMTRPICSPDVRLTMSVPSWLQGGDLSITKCTILADGRICDCSFIKPPPEDEQARLLAWFAVQRCRPVRLRGEPLTVEYVFNIRPGN